MTYINTLISRILQYASAGFVFTGAATLWAISASFNFQYALTIDPDGQLTHYAYPALAVGGDAAKVALVFTIAMATKAVDRWLYRLILVMCIAWSLLSAYSRNLTTSVDGAVNTVATAERYARAKQAYTIADHGLRRLSLVRNASEIKADIAAIEALEDGRIGRNLACDAPKDSRKYGPVSRKYCPKVAALQAELAKAKESDAYMAELLRNRTIMDAIGTPKQAAPAASGIANATGLSVAGVMFIRSVFLAILIELLSTFGFRIAAQLTGWQPNPLTPVGLASNGSARAGHKARRAVALASSPTGSSDICHARTCPTTPENWTSDPVIKKLVTGYAVAVEEPAVPSSRRQFTAMVRGLIARGDVEIKLAELGKKAGVSASTASRWLKAMPDVATTRMSRGLALAVA
jgi:hypothetical protein